MKQIVWISEQVAITVHNRQLAQHGGMSGIRDNGLLQSALHRPKNFLAFSESSPDIASLAAAYGYGIVKNHPFVDGNKRTSYIVMRTFLILNGCDISATDEEKYRIWIAIASGEMTEAQLADWIRKHLV